MDFIRGENFIQLADNEYIFYRHTHEVNNFFEKEAPKTPFILISHNSDGSIEETASRSDGASFSKAPKNLIKWFGQNIKCKHKKIKPLPIGMENSNWFSEVKKIEKIIDIVGTIKKIENLIYLNLNISTNPTERGFVYELCKSKSYVTVEQGKNEGNLFDNYIRKVYNHNFVVSVAGNGEDCHRTWETLYSNSIPILKRTVNSQLYENLPVCFVDDWEQLNDREYFEKELIRINNSKFNLNKLYFNYWKKLIYKEKEKLQKRKNNEPCRL
jgi:hypothetical protein